jgi:hypothetical protein
MTARHRALLVGAIVGALVLGAASCKRPAPAPAQEEAIACSTKADCPRAQSCFFDTPGCSARGTCDTGRECEAPSDYCACTGKTVRACAPREPYSRAGACATTP